jgi:hypothetical protein
MVSCLSKAVRMDAEGASTAFRLSGSASARNSNANKEVSDEGTIKV